MWLCITALLKFSRLHNCDMDRSSVLLCIWLSYVEDRIRNFPHIFGLWSLSVLLADLDRTVRILLYSLIFLISILGNTLVIVVLIRNKRMRTVTNIFLLSLAISDLMLSFFCMPFTLIPNLLKDFIFGSALCKITSYFMGECELSTFFTLAVMTVGFKLFTFRKLYLHSLVCCGTPAYLPGTQPKFGVIF